MSGGTSEVHRDDEPLITGTHDGASGSTTLRDMSRRLRSLGARAGLYIENETQATASLIATVTDNTMEITTDDAISWDNGDTYNIYKTASKGSLLSSNWVDVSAGWKTPKGELSRGWRTEDVDIDRDRPGKVFGPGQPERDHG